MADIKRANEAVEVVRCKDCIYWGGCKDYIPYCNHEDGLHTPHLNENDYCSYGVRNDKRRD